MCRQAVLTASAGIGDYAVNQLRTLDESNVFGAGKFLYA
jgi:hypothetical protein